MLTVTILSLGENGERARDPNFIDFDGALNIICMESLGDQHPLNLVIVLLLKADDNLRDHLHVVAVAVVFLTHNG